MIRDESFALVVGVSPEGSFSVLRKCRTKYEAEEEAEKLAKEFHTGMIVAMECHKAFRSVLRVEPVYLSYPSIPTLDLAELETETKAESPPALSGVSVTEDF